MFSISNDLCMLGITPMFRMQWPCCHEGWRKDKNVPAHALEAIDDRLPDVCPVKHGSWNDWLNKAGAGEVYDAGIEVGAVVGVCLVGEVKAPALESQHITPCRVYGPCEVDWTIDVHDDPSIWVED